LIELESVVLHRALEFLTKKLVPRKPCVDWIFLESPMQTSVFGSWIGSIRVLDKQPQSDKAREIMNQIVAHVIPIMKSRGWKVPRVSEMFPNNPGLLGLNINRGQEIKIRLRPADNPAHFLPLESLIMTM
jgi:hypothetical protein